MVGSDEAVILRFLHATVAVADTHRRMLAGVGEGTRSRGVEASDREGSSGLTRRGPPDGSSHRLARRAHWRQRRRAMAPSESAIQQHFEALQRGDADTVAALLTDDFVQDWPQSGERVRGREACLRIYANYPGGGPTVTLKRIVGSGKLGRGSRCRLQRQAGQDGGHPGVSGRVAGPRDRLFRRPVRGAGVADAMGRAHCLADCDDCEQRQRHSAFQPDLDD